MLNSKESKNERTKKTIQLLFIVVAVFVVITAAVIIGIILYNYYNHNNYSTSSSHPNVTEINHYSGIDKFGVKEIYPTEPGGQEWFMNMRDIVHDPRTLFTAAIPTLTKNLDGSWKVSSPEVRYNIFTSSGYRPELITTLNQTQLATKGYMQSPNDWKNVEITAYLKLVNQGGYVTGASGDLLGGHYTMYARGGMHKGFGPTDGGCEGTSYHGDWAYDGATRFAKEQRYPSYIFTPFKPSSGPIESKWVGFKTIMYNIQQNGKTAVKMEIWVDTNGNGNWVKVNEFVDSGGWGNAGAECGDSPDQIITWGGPIVTYRWDNSPDVDIKDFSVREIQATNQ